MENTIVVLDDEPDIRKIIRLVKLVLNVNPAESSPEEDSNIREAARLVSEHFNPDVIRLDIKIAGLDPVVICERIKSDMQLSAITTLVEKADVVDRRGV